MTVPHLLLILTSAFAWVAPALALEEGDPAPPLSIAQWLLGQPVTDVGRPGNNIYVVSFWATWSEPARQSLFELSELQNKMKHTGVAVVAVSSEPLKTVQEFVQRHRKRLSVRVASDDKRKTTIAFMGAIAEHALPHAFVVDKKGIFVWHGHPAELAGVLNQVNAGTYQIAKQDPPPVADAEDDSEKADRERVLREATLEQLALAYQETVRTGNHRAALELIDLMLDKTEDAADKEQLLQEKFTLLYEGLGDFESARDLAEKVLREHPDKAVLLNVIAWTLLARGDFENLSNRWPEIAHKAARLAYEASKGENPAIVDTYARSRCLLGKLKEAVKLQERAISLFSGQLDERRKEKFGWLNLEELESALRDLQATLEYYKDVAALQNNEN